MSIINILDTAGALSLASGNALDLLNAGGRRVLITRQVLAEIQGASSANYVKVQQWLDANPQLWERLDFDVSQSDLDKYGLEGKQSSADAGWNIQSPRDKGLL